MSTRFVPVTSVLFATAIAACAPSGGSTNADAATPQNIGACGPDALILDAESSEDQVLLRQGRSGWLYSFIDETGSTVTPAPNHFAMSEGGANGSAKAARFTGKLGTGSVVYAGIGFGFNERAEEAYDATKFAGISFFAKAAEGSTQRIRVKVPDVNTDPNGKVCGECFNDFGVNLDLTNEWTQYVVPFGEMRQEPGWGAPQTPAIEPNKLYGVQFMVNTSGADFDIWIDDVAFVCAK